MNINLFCVSGLVDSTELHCNSSQWKYQPYYPHMSEIQCLPYGSKCLGKIMAYLMSFDLYLCDWSVPYCASLEAWYWVVAGQHLNASHPRSSVWPNPNITWFSGKLKKKTLNCHRSWTFRAFELIPKLRARPEYQLASVIKYTAWLASAFPPDRNHP